MQCEELICPKLNKLLNVWEEIGITDETLIRRQDLVVGLLSNVVDEMIAVEESLKERLSASVQGSEREVKKLLQELCISPEMFNIELCGHCLIKRDKLLRCKMEELMDEKQQRLSKFKELCQLEKQLCDSLGLSTYAHDIVLKSVPSYEELEKLSDRISTLEAKKRLSTDPSRQINRGGVLLRDNSQRKKLLKKLPALQKLIDDEVSTWNEMEVHIDGKSFSEYTRLQWQDYELRKEQEKNRRQQEKSQTLLLEMKFGSRSAKKRSIPTTPVLATKLPRMDETRSTSCVPRVSTKNKSVVPSLKSNALQRRSNRFNASRMDKHNNPSGPGPTTTAAVPWGFGLRPVPTNSVFNTPHTTLTRH